MAMCQHQVNFVNMEVGRINYLKCYFIWDALQVKDSVTDNRDSQN